MCVFAKCICSLFSFFFATADQIKFYYYFKALRLSFLLLPHPVAAEIKHIRTCIRTNMCMHSPTYTYICTYTYYYIQLLISHSLTQYENALYLSLSYSFSLSILFHSSFFVSYALLFVCCFVCLFVFFIVTKTSRR